MQRADDTLGPTDAVLYLALYFTAVLALFAFDYDLAINSLIGLLMLMGIVSKNSILIVEYAIMAQRDQGMSRFDSSVSQRRR